jgi:hypothetical protein
MLVKKCKIYPPLCFIKAVVLLSIYFTCLPQLFATIPQQLASSPIAAYNPPLDFACMQNVGASSSHRGEGCTKGGEGCPLDKKRSRWCEQPSPRLVGLYARRGGLFGWQNICSVDAYNLPLDANCMQNDAKCMQNEGEGCSVVAYNPLLDAYKYPYHREGLQVERVVGINASIYRGLVLAVVEVHNHSP